MICVLCETPTHRAVHGRYGMISVCDEHLSPLTVETNNELIQYEDRMKNTHAVPLANDTIIEATQANDNARRDLEALKAMPITMANMALVGDILKKVKAQAKYLKSRQDAITRPLREAEKGIRDLFRPGLDALEEAERHLKAGIGVAERAHHEANRQAALEAQAALQQGSALAAAIASSNIAPAVPVQGITTREVMQFAVVDPNLVPRELCSPDEAKIRAAIALGVREIPGVQIAIGTQVTVRQ